ncbi:hypothetical protein AVEN_56547-1, partial [Araneus ventricosus]
CQKRNLEPATEVPADVSMCSLLKPLADGELTAARFSSTSTS